MEANFVAKFLKGVLATGLGTVATLVLGFVNIGIAVRFIPKEEFGVFLLIQTIVFSVVMIADLGLNISTTKFLAASDEAEKATIVNTALVLRGIIVVITALIVTVLKSGVDFVFKSESLTDLYFYVPILIAAESYNALLSAILQGLQQYRRLAYAQIAASAANVAFIIVTVVLLRFSVHGLIISRLAAVLLAVLYQMKIAGVRVRPRIDQATAKKMTGFGIFLGVNNILSFLFMRIDTLIIGAVMNPVGVALYGTASKIPDASRQIFESFRSVFFPNIAELFGQQKNREAESILNQSLRLVSFLSLLVSLLMIVFRNEIVTLLFSSKYMECGPVLSLLMVAMCIGLIGSVLGTSLVAAGHPRLPAFINVVDATVCVIANLVFIPAFGIIGAAYAAIIARAATNPINVYFLRKHHINVKVSQFLKPAAVFTLCCVLLATGDGYLNKVLVLLLYLLLSTALLIVTKDDIQMLRRVFTFQAQPATLK
jgi:O-antigen/teichoic acid export membrane protein